MLHMILIDVFCECFRVDQTSIGTSATIETEVTQPASTSSLANQCTVGAAYRLSLHDMRTFANQRNSALCSSLPARGRLRCLHKLIANKALDLKSSLQVQTSHLAGLRASPALLLSGGCLELEGASCNID